MLSSKTLSVSIACEPARVYEYVRDPSNLPQWAPAFCKSVRPAADDNWVVETPHGPVGLRFVERNALGVLDHQIRPTPDFEIHVPMRVLPNQAGSEVLFTLFRLPDLSDERFAEDAGLVQQDLDTLKRILETIV